MKKIMPIALCVLVAAAIAAGGAALALGGEKSGAELAATEQTDKALLSTEAAEAEAVIAEQPAAAPAAESDTPAEATPQAAPYDPPFVKTESKETTPEAQAEEFKARVVSSQEEQKAFYAKYDALTAELKGLGGAKSERANELNAELEQLLFDSSSYLELDCSLEASFTRLCTQLAECADELLISLDISGADKNTSEYQGCIERKALANDLLERCAAGESIDELLVRYYERLDEINQISANKSDPPFVKTESKETTPEAQAEEFKARVASEREEQAKIVAEYDGLKAELASLDAKKAEGALTAEELGRYGEAEARVNEITLNMSLYFEKEYTLGSEFKSMCVMTLECAEQEMSSVGAKMTETERAQELGKKALAEDMLKRIAAGEDIEELLLSFFTQIDEINQIVIR